jgi:hypothetical protein
MKHIGLQSLAGVALLLFAFSGIGRADGSSFNSTDPRVVNAPQVNESLPQDAFGMYESGHDAIGTGSMESPFRLDDPRVINAPLGNEGESDISSTIGSHDAVGTGSMESIGPPKADWPSGYDARPGIEGP